MAITSTSKTRLIYSGLRVEQDGYVRFDVKTFRLFASTPGADAAVVFLRLQSGQLHILTILVEVFDGHPSEAAAREYLLDNRGRAARYRRRLFSARLHAVIARSLAHTIERRLNDPRQRRQRPKPPPPPPHTATQPGQQTAGPSQPTAPRHDPGSRNASPADHILHDDTSDDDETTRRSPQP